MSIDRLKIIEEEIDRRLQGKKKRLDLSLSKLFDISFKLKSSEKHKNIIKDHPNNNIEPAR